MMKQYALSIGFFLLSASAAFAQTKTPVEGVWKIAEVVVQQGHENDWLSGETSAEETTTITNPQPGLIIFTRNHYSQLVVRGNKPRAAVAPPKDPRNLTDAEKIALFEQWRVVIANAGTYEVKGSTLFIRGIVAKNVAPTTRETAVQVTFTLEGPNTLWLSSPTVPTEARTKLTRVE
jgi:hypothetical protein